MEQLEKSGLISILNKKVIEEKTPILGICLGVQLMTQKSEEGNIKGLSWFDAETVKFDSTKMPSNYKIPHMSWSDVDYNVNSKLFKDIPQEPRFYFVHSYHLLANNAKEILATANYGYKFAVGLEHENIVGVQFHPEKSHKFGMQILRNFVELF
jgi:glutamine amidotransferase